MRVSNTMLTDNYLYNLSRNMEKLMKQQAQISTGKRITKLSDDPVGAITTMNASVRLARIEQYKKNIGTAEAWISQTESSVLELNEVVKSAYESAVSSSNDYWSPYEKEATAELIAELRDHVLSLANGKTGDRYLFGGYNTISPPFKVDSGTGDLIYNGINMYNPTDPDLIAEGEQIVEFEVSYGIKAEVSVPGTQLLGTGEDNIYKILDDFYNALKADAPATELTQYVDKLSGAQGRLLTVESVIGGRTNRLELVSLRHEDDYLNYETIKSKVEDVDQAEAIVKYKMTESIYIASLQISADIIQPTLVDFLK